MPLALVTGTRPHLGPAAATLARAGFNVMTWAAGSSTPPSQGPYDCYVQLPCAQDDFVAPPPQRATSGRPGRRTADDLVCRVDVLAAVVARLNPNASILLAVDEVNPSGAGHPAAPAADLLGAVALALLEDLGRSTTRLAVLPVAQLYRRAPAPIPLDSLIGAGQWEMPTPPLVSAP